MLLWSAISIFWIHRNLLLLFTLHLVSCQARARLFSSFSPDAPITGQPTLGSFYPNSVASATPASSVNILRSTSFVESRSSCPLFNASLSPIALNSPLENESVDCGGYREYVYNVTGSCSNKVFFMVVLTSQDIRAPFASISVSLTAPHLLKTTTYGSPSPNRRYYVLHILSTCPGT
jgi:hypothetical protein